MPPEHILQPLVLTAVFDPPARDWLETLRRTHFPLERNHVPAHLTLFHALPGSASSGIQRELEAECMARGRCAASFLSWRFTGHGVAREIASLGLFDLRSRLAERWKDRLTLQDRKPWRPHVTVQNKVPPDEARALYVQLSGAKDPGHATVSGLILWRYLGGPWEMLRSFAFESHTPGPDGFGQPIGQPIGQAGRATSGRNRH
jgi:hypothetical protein